MPSANRAQKSARAEGGVGRPPPGRHVIFEIERRHELAEHRCLADRLQAAAAGRDEGAFLDQIEHVAGAVGHAIPYFLWNGLV